MSNRFALSTPRLTLVAADEALLQAEIQSPAALGVAVDSVVPTAWPPEHHDQGVIEWLLKSSFLTQPEGPWRFFYMVLNSPCTLIGTCGFKGAPDGKGCVEVGYSVLPEFRCRGFASEAVRTLMGAAFASGACEVAAETFPQLGPSLRVMEKCGMTAVGAGSEPGTVRYSVRTFAIGCQ